MFFVLSKTVGQLADPWWLALTLLGLGVLLRLLGRLPRLRRGLVVLGVGLLWVFSTGAVANLLLAPLEGRHARPARLPARLGAIVMFSGQTDRPDPRGGDYELTSSADRFVETLRLARAHPEAMVLLSGGHSALFPRGQHLEAAVLGRLAQELGLPAKRLQLDVASRTTRENAVESARLLARVKGPVVLVTSAMHMPRSVACLQQLGLSVIPWPVDFRATGYGPGAFLPEPQSLQRSRSAVHEYVGYLAYWVRGFV